MVTVKGLEGGTDLPTGRACITARVDHGEAQRLILHPRDHDCHEADLGWTDPATWVQQALAALNNSGPLLSALRWNAGVYLWFAGQSATLEAGLERAQEALENGTALTALQQLQSWSKALAMR